MRIHEVDLGEDVKTAYLLPISDMHIGDPAFDQDKFLGYRNWVEQTPNAYIILNGDILNTAIKNSVSDVYREIMNPREALNAAVKLLEPVKDRILCLVGGNHERRIRREVGFDTPEVLAAKLGVHYAGDECYLKIKMGKATGKKGNGLPIIYCCYITHGWGSGRTAGSKVNNLQRLADIVLADIYIASHTHFMTSHQDVYLIPDKSWNKLHEMKRTFVSSGAFLKRGGYAVTKGYPHAKLGSPRIRLDGTRKDVHVSL